MNIKKRLIILNFLEFFSWGSWLLSAGVYMITTLKFSGLQVGSIYATLGIAAMFMPPLMGIIADKWLNSQKLFGISHLLLTVLFLLLTKATSFNSFYIIMFILSMFYMPTLALNNSMSYYLLEAEGYNSAKKFPSIRVWGTIGFIIAAWVIDLLGLKISENQFYLGAITSLILGIYGFLLPNIPINKSESKTLFQRFGLDAFKLFKDKNIAIFLCFSIFVGCALQVTNIWGVPFLDDFKHDYADSFAVKHSIFLLTLSQISEVVFILAIPFFLKKFGIKKVVLISIFAWVFRFGLFGIGNPEGMGLVYLILSMLIYGVAFDFYFISGSLYINHKAGPSMRSGAQGLFMMMVNGFGAALGSYLSGFVVDLFTVNGVKEWSSIWFVFAVYAFIVGTLFLLLFKHKHQKENELIK